MNGTKLKITFYLTSGSKVSTLVNIGDLCEKKEDGTYTLTTADATVNFKSIESFAVVLKSGITSTINEWYMAEDKKECDEAILEFGDVVVPIEKVAAAKVRAIFEDEIPEENYVTVEEIED